MLTVYPKQLVEKLSKKDQVVLIILAIISVLAYFWSLGTNNIWTPNEGYYAEAIREMFESGNYWDIFYNYEPRYQKPPLFYWLIVASTKIFGLNEFAIRLPSVLTGLGTAFLTYKIGTFLHSKKLGCVAVMMLLFSFQFVINTRYASPAISLTFFYTLTLYWFLKAYHLKNNGYLFAAYFALGLTLLTKGYPYLIVIGSIILLYTLFSVQYDWKEYFRKLLWMKLPIGIPLALLIGFSWIASMWIINGDEFYEVFMNETFRRAFTKKSSLKPFFYIEANLWGFLPYSLVFFYALVHLAITRFQALKKEGIVQFSLAWFIVMLVIFTIAKGKIPTYFIQAHPGMSLLTAYFILSYQPSKQWTKGLLNTFYFLPGILFTILSVGIVYVFNGFFLFYLIAVLPLVGLYLGQKYNLEYLKLYSFPFTGIWSTYILFAMIVLPYVEADYRNHDKIGEAILERVPDKSIPLFVEDEEGLKMHNLPYYAERKVNVHIPHEEMRKYNQDKPLLALIAADKVDEFGNVEVLWTGNYYLDSEGKTLEFILNVMKAKRGEPSEFAKYSVIYAPID